MGSGLRDSGSPIEIWGSVLGLDIGVWYPGRVYTASGRKPGSALAGTCVLPAALMCILGARSVSLGRRFAEGNAEPYPGRSL